MNSYRRCAVLMVVILSAAAAAKDRIAIVAFKGDGAPKVRAQVSKALCKANICVNPGKGGKKVSVDGVVTGVVKGSRAKKTLMLAVHTADEDGPIERRIALDRKGLLNKKSLKTVTSTVKTSLKPDFEVPDSALSLAN